MSGKLKYSEIVIYGDKKKDEAIKMKIGFIGLGIMGKPMAKNLIRAGYELIVYDFNQDAVEELVSCGAKAAVNVSGRGCYYNASQFSPCAGGGAW